MSRNLDYMLSVMTAAKEGKPIEYRFITGTSDWQETPTLLWNWSACDYRVKPEKKKLYVVLNKNDARIATSEDVDAISKHFNYLINTGEHGPYRIVTFVEQ